MNDATQFFDTVAGAGGGYQIERSLRFNSADSAYLNRTPGSAGNRKTWTWAGWVKRCEIFNQRIFTAGSDGNNHSLIEFTGTNQSQLEVRNYISAYKTLVTTSALFRDPSAWYHIVVSCTSSSLKIYVNGTETAYSSVTGPDGSDWFFNSTVSHTIGRSAWGSEYFGGYLADIHFIDGQALDPTSFGEFDINGVWQPIAYSGSYGTNGFHLPFSDNSTAAALGTDTSGNSNNWTPNNLSVSTGSVASPVRFTWSTAGSGWTLSNSNYTATSSLSNTYSRATTAALDGGTTYRFVLRQTPADGVGGWFFADTTSVSNTHPDELGGNSLGMRVAESTIGAYGTFATANGTGGGQDQITGLSSLTSSSGNTTYSEWVVNMTARKVWVRNLGDSTWLKGGDPSNTSSTPTFSLPSGTIYFGYVGYNGSNIISLDTSVPSVAAGNDSLVDSPTNYGTDTGAGGEVRGNYATLNPLDLSANISLTNGNLNAAVASGSSSKNIRSTIFPASGKWYWEMTNNTVSTFNMIGIASRAVSLTSGAALNQTGGYAYGSDGNFYITSTVDSTPATFTSGDVIGCAWDIGAGTLQFYKNGASQGTISSIPSGEYSPAFTVTSGSDSLSVNFGQRPFAYTAPSGFKALCTTNLPEPTIADGSTAMDVVTYTGNGSTQTISGLNFSPDLVWIKTRSNTVGHNLYDVIRGVNKPLITNSTAAEDATNIYGAVSAFNSDGFDVQIGSTDAIRANASGYTYVAWTWDAGSSTVTNTRRQHHFSGEG
jgi:hypothetical protein